MNLSPFLEEKFKAATTTGDLKAVITDIMDEYDYGILIGSLET